MISERNNTNWQVNFYSPGKKGGARRKLTKSDKKEMSK